MNESAGQRYDLLEPIAAGGMGEVFVGSVRGEHGFQKPVAIKRILPELAHDPDFVLRFVTEAKLAVSLSHANVVQVFDLGRAGDELLLVMEYVRGTDLAQLIAQLGHQGKATPPAVGVYVAVEALKGLVYAHERRDGEGGIGVIHCDVSPSNLLVSWAGEVKIGDFGVAQALEVARRSRTTGGVRGKVRYLAPEQLLGEPIDARTDLYSLAVVLYELLSGARPFDRPDADAIAAAVVAGGQPALATLRPDVPEALDRLIMQTMARDPRQRPASARAMLAELTRISQKLDPVTAPDVGAWARAIIDGPAVQAAAGAHPATLSAVAPAPPRNPTMSFVVRRTVDGVTVLEKTKTSLPRPRKRPWAMVSGLALGTAAFVALAAWRSTGATLVQRAASAPSAASAPTTFAPRAVPEPTVAAASAPSGASAAAAPAHPAPLAASAPASHGPRAGRPAHAANPGFINIYAEPWAHVTVDGKAIGSTPIAHLPLPPGVHTVRFTNPHARSAERLVRIAAGKVQLLDMDLEPRP